MIVHTAQVDPLPGFGWAAAATAAQLDVNELTVNNSRFDEEPLAS